MKELEDGLADIERLLQSKKTQFVSGPHGLQAKRARAIQTHLSLMVRNGQKFIDASQRAAEANGFAKYGACQLHTWTRTWLNSCDLPTSQRSCHTKVYSLLNDPSIAAECRAYLRSHKWSMNPETLAKFTAGKLVGSAAKKYLEQLVNEEMPTGLKKYLELELFPCIHMKVSCGISLSTARCWLHAEGFHYISHKKGLYFDGHDRPDVVDYHQNVFLPFIKSCEHRLVHYKVGDVKHEEDVDPGNYVECRLVLVSHDETTGQANNDHDKSWVRKDEFSISKPALPLSRDDSIPRATPLWSGLSGLSDLW